MQFVKLFLEHIQQAAPMVRLEVQPTMIRGNDELEGVFAAMARERSDAVVVQSSLPVKLTVDLALKYRLPSLSAQTSDAHAETPGHVQREFCGAKPSGRGLCGQHPQRR